MSLNCGISLHQEYHVSSTQGFIFQLCMCFPSSVLEVLNRRLVVCWTTSDCCQIWSISMWCCLISYLDLGGDVMYGQFYGHNPHFNLFVEDDMRLFIGGN